MFSLKMSPLGEDRIVFFKYLKGFQTEERLASFFDSPEKITRTKEGRWW